MFLWIQSKNYLAKIKSGLRIRMNFFQKYFSIWVNDEIIVSSEVAVNKKWSPRFSQLSTKGAQEAIWFWHAEESVWKKNQKIVTTWRSSFETSGNSSRSTGGRDTPEAIKFTSKRRRRELGPKEKR